MTDGGAAAGEENCIYISKSSVVDAPTALTGPGDGRRAIEEQGTRVGGFAANVDDDYDDDGGGDDLRPTTIRGMKWGVGDKAGGKYPFINGFKSREMHLTRNLLPIVYKYSTRQHRTRIRSPLSPVLS